jgi:Cu2+-exporting ATPase
LPAPGGAAGAPAVPACFHCGLPVADPGRYRARVLGGEREMCCAGCEAVARTIVAAGFERYYETREPVVAGALPAGLEGLADADVPARTPLAQDLPPTAIYDDPEAQRQFVAARGEHERVATLILDRIRCAACLWLNERWLRRLHGVLRADINYATQRAQVAWDPSRVKLSQILDAVRAIGYDAYPYDPRRQDEIERRENRRMLWRLFVAGFGAMQVMMYAFPAYIDAGTGTLTPDAERLMRWASLVLTLPVMLFSSRPFLDGAWRDLRRRSVGLDTPIALGLVTGFVASVWATVAGRGEVYFDSLSMLVFLLLGARYVEHAARRRAARELDHLARWMPAFALRLADPGQVAGAQRVPAHRLAPGELVLVPPGERIPADGVLVSGATSVDESLLTGESRPLAKAPGADLVGGSINLEQALVMRVVRAGAGTQAAAIARLVERAAAGRPKLVERADRLARALTGVVLVIAAGAFLYWLEAAPERAWWVAVAVFVVTCPCALALAAPIVLTRANGQLLARGVALTRAPAIETLERVTDVVLDKTGTLSTGHVVLAQAVALGDAGERECIAWAGALEAASRHPIARAFAAAGPFPAAAEVRNFPGHGLEGLVAGRRMRVGTEAFCRELCGAPAPERARAAGDAAAGFSPVFLADAGRWLAMFLLEDPLRADAGDFVRMLDARGLRTHLLSGDDPQVVESVARRLAIASFAARATPQDKFAFVARLQREGRVVAMLGDGLNDAPVLARADVSFAMGCGADAAQAQADMVLLGSGERTRLSAAGDAFAFAASAMSVIRQNLAWAVAYNVVALPAAAVGWIGPWEAAIGMTASSFIVVLNAMRPLARAVRTSPDPAALALAPSEGAQG